MTTRSPLAPKQRKARSAQQRKARSTRPRKARGTRQRKAPAPKQRKARVTRQRKAGSTKQRKAPAPKQRKTPAAKRQRASSAQPSVGAPSRTRRPYSVRHSPIHGRGVFATRSIRKGSDIVEYRGRRISMEAADELPDSDPDNPFHTFLFELNDGRVIDAGRGGNAARWINHSCRPNCEPYEDDDGRVFIAATRTIRAGEELSYDYKLNVPGRRTPRLLADYACRCGAPRCRGTMIDLRKRRGRGGRSVA